MPCADIKPRKDYGRNKRRIYEPRAAAHLPGWCQGRATARSPTVRKDRRRHRAAHLVHLRDHAAMHGSLPRLVAQTALRPHHTRRDSCHRAFLQTVRGHTLRLGPTAEERTQAHHPTEVIRQLYVVCQRCNGGSGQPLDHRQRERHDTQLCHCRRVQVPAQEENRRRGDACPLWYR